jgi:hypothetical protein
MSNEFSNNLQKAKKIEKTSDYFSQSTKNLTFHLESDGHPLLFAVRGRLFALFWPGNFLKKKFKKKLTEYTFWAYTMFTQTLISIQ